MANDRNIEIEDSHHTALLDRIAAMKHAGWTAQEIRSVVTQWPVDWQRLVAKAVKVVPYNVHYEDY